MKKETGLMFKAPLVLAILAGQKTQTRRVLTPQPMTVADRSTKDWEGTADALMRQLQAIGRKCPMGQPGDRIYVRETHRFPASLDKSSAAKIAEQCLDAGYNSPWCPTLYEADGKRRENWNDFATPPLETAPGKLRPSLLMPKYAARIWLEITGVRVERLQDISEDDAKAEGAVLKNSPAAHLTSYRRGFQELWESTGGDWSANPWVWVIDFKTISTTGRPA